MEIHQSELELLSKRVQKLESRSRRWKFASVLFGITTVSLVIMAAKASGQVDRSVLRTRILEAQELVLQDENGHVYARLTRFPKLEQLQRLPRQTIPVPLQSGYLQFYDANGKPTWTEPRMPMFKYIPGE